ncbi:MAG TPA: TolC family protein [Pirellulales bacterium]
MGANRNKAKTTATALACSIAMLLPGCHIPDLRGPQPAQPTPQTFNGDNFNAEVSCANSAHLGIDQFFTDPILISLVHQGLSGNQELKILNEEIQIANNEVRRRRGAIFPFVTLGGGVGIDRPGEFTRAGAVESQLEVAPGRGFPDPLPNFMTAADVSWQVDIWRELRNARDAQVLRFLGTIDGRNYTVTRLVAEISENYYQLLALDMRLENLTVTIELQEKSLDIAKARKEAARGTELAVQRFQAEVQRNKSDLFIIQQQIIEVGNRINFLLGRYPQAVERYRGNFFDLELPAIHVGVPSQLMLNRPDIRQAERELQAAGLEVKVARARFFPALRIRAGIGYEAFNPRYLFQTPESLAYNVAGDLVAPLINRSAIKADYMNANAEQLQRLYDYQRTILNAFTEVINRVTRVDNYTKSIAYKRQQLASLEASVAAASSLFQNARAEYVDVLLALRDTRDARNDLIEAKREQLSAIVNAYQALGGGWQMSPQGVPAAMVAPMVAPVEVIEPVQPNELPDPVETSDLEEAPAPPGDDDESLTVPEFSKAGTESLEIAESMEEPPVPEELAAETADPQFEEISR